MMLKLTSYLVLLSVTIAQLGACHTNSTKVMINNALKLPIDVSACADGKLLQLNRALVDLHTLIQLAEDTLLHRPAAKGVQMYFGKAVGEADLAAPIGLLTRLKDGSKHNVVLTCDDSQDKAHDICATRKQFADEGGLVVRAKNGTSTIVVCADNFSTGRTTPPPRKYLEDICQDDWTLNSNTPTTFWAASLLALLMHVPELSAPQMHDSVRAYANVVDLGRRDPQDATHNIYTYLYLLLDLFAQTHVKGGCEGQPMGRVHEQAWSRRRR